MAFFSHDYNTVNVTQRRVDQDLSNNVVLTAKLLFLLMILIFWHLSTGVWEYQHPLCSTHLIASYLMAYALILLTDLNIIHILA